MWVSIYIIYSIHIWHLTHTPHVMTEEIIKQKSDEVAPESDTKLRNRTKPNKKSI